MIKQTSKHEKTLNRTFNKFVKSNVFSNFRKYLTLKYISSIDISDLKIDSTDIINADCNKKELDRSWKLHKQAVKSTLIDDNMVCLNYALDKPIINDSKAELDLILNSKLSKNKNKRLYLSANKGYILKKNDIREIIKSKNIMLVTPKKIYKKKNIKKKYYKKRIIRHSEQMTKSLKTRIKVEHFNSIIHRFYKRLSRFFDRTLKIFKGFLEIALSIIIISRLY